MGFICLTAVVARVEKFIQSVFLAIRGNEKKRVTVSSLQVAHGVDKVKSFFQGKENFSHCGQLFARLLEDCAPRQHRWIIERLAFQ
jgi:deoxyhypusine synthase